MNHKKELLWGLGVTSLPKDRLEVIRSEWHLLCWFCGEVRERFRSSPQVLFLRHYSTPRHPRPPPAAAPVVCLRPRLRVGFWLHSRPDLPCPNGPMKPVIPKPYKLFTRRAPKPKDRGFRVYDIF